MLLHFGISLLNLLKHYVIRSFKLHYLIHPEFNQKYGNIINTAARNAG